MMCIKLLYILSDFSRKPSICLLTCVYKLAGEEGCAVKLCQSTVQNNRNRFQSVPKFFPHNFREFHFNCNSFGTLYIIESEIKQNNSLKLFMRCIIFNICNMTKEAFDFCDFNLDQKRPETCLGISEWNRDDF